MKAGREPNEVDSVVIVAPLGLLTGEKTLNLFGSIKKS